MKDDQILEIIQRIEENYNIAVDDKLVTAVNYNMLKDGKTYSLSLGGGTFLKTKQMKDTYRLYVKDSIIDELNISPFVEIKKLSSDPDFTSLNFLERNDEYYKIIEICVDNAIKTFQPSNMFACCDLYKACSDEKKCIHRDRLYSKGCWYRRNLENGKIFYGKNKNC
jgi:hypothetical protein